MIRWTQKKLNMPYWLWLIFFLVALFVLGRLTYFISNTAIETLLARFTKAENLGNLMNLLIGLLAAFTFWATIRITIFLITEEFKINKYLSWFIFLSLFLFITGSMFIHQFTEPPTELELALRDSSSSMKEAEINCKPDNNYIYFGDNMTCNITPKINNISGEVRFKDEAGNLVFSQSLNNNLVIKIPSSKVNRIEFDVKGVNNHNINKEYEIGWTFKAINKGEREELNNKFISYMLTLLLVVFVSVPTALVSIKHLLEKKK